MSVRRSDGTRFGPKWAHESRIGIWKVVPTVVGALVPRFAPRVPAALVVAALVLFAVARLFAKRLCGRVFGKR
jgi:hypothetical protein